MIKIKRHPKPLDKIRYKINLGEISFSAIFEYKDQQYALNFVEWLNILIILQISPDWTKRSQKNDNFYLILYLTSFICINFQIRLR